MLSLVGGSSVVLRLVWSTLSVDPPPYLNVAGTQGKVVTVRVFLKRVHEDRITLQNSQPPFRFDLSILRFFFFPVMLDSKEPDFSFEFTVPVEKCLR